MVDLNDEARAEIQDLRTEQADFEDRVAAAERDIERAEADIDVAEQELDVAENQVEEIEARIRAARSDDDRRALRDEDLADARMRVSTAHAEIQYREAMKDVAEAERELTERRVDLATARIEHRKARAVASLDDDHDVDVHPYSDSVRAAKLDVRLAEIDVERAKMRAEAHAEARDAIGDGGSIQLEEDRRNDADDDEA